MNVVFLLLTTAVGAGADPLPAKTVEVPPATAPVVAAPIVAAPIASGCGCGGCGAVSDSCGCDHGHKPSFFDRLFSRSHKASCDSCCASAPAPCASCGTTSSCAHDCGCDSHKPSFFDRLRAKFSKSSCCEPACDSCGCSSCGSSVSPAPYGAPAGVLPSGTPDKPAGEKLKMPKGDPEKPASAPAKLPVGSAGAKIETEVKNPFELARRYEKREKRATDYSKLTGQLSYVHADGGLWVLRYASLSEEDANGGSVILARDRKMDNYREGDLVTIEGQVLSQKGSARLGGPLYQIQTISLVDRPQQ